MGCCASQRQADTVVGPEVSAAASKMFAARQAHQDARDQPDAPGTKHSALVAGALLEQHQEGAQ